jgi:hypothetical protein
MIKLYHSVLIVAFFLSVLYSGYPNPTDTLKRETVVKIAIDEDGMYRITYFDLLDIGLNPAEINPNRMYLTNCGKVVPIYLNGTGQNTWNKSANFDFYATANRDSSGSLDKYSNVNEYFLHWDKSTIGGTRFTLCTASSPGNQSKVSAQTKLFRVNTHWEGKSTHSRSSNLTEEGSWFWRQISAPSDILVSFNLPGQTMEMSKFCSIHIKFQGTSHLAINPDHYIVVTINQNYIGEARWDGETAYIFSNDSVPVYYFQKGNNTLGISMPGTSGDPRGIAPDLDVVYFSWFEIGYWSEYQATNNNLTYYYGNDSLKFDIQSTLTITNFTNNSIMIYDLTNHTKIIPWVMASAMVNQDTVYSASYAVNQQSQRHDYIALTDEQIKAPIQIEKRQVSRWRNPSLGADYIIISHVAFYDSLLPLVQWRQSQGLRVTLVDAEDIYDEFNQGILHPQAIRNFLKYAYYHWEPPRLKYVLLVGDASWDIKNNMNLAGGYQYLPVYYYPSFSGYAACDNWYGCIEEEDTIPEIAIGRIPAQSVDQVQVVVNKILEYEQKPNFGPWRQSVLLLATPRSWTRDVNADLINNILPKQLIPIPQYATTTAKFNITPKDIIQFIDEGQFLVHFAGHSSVLRWDIGRPGEEAEPEAVGYKDIGFFGINHIPELRNRNRYPLVIAMTCFANQYDLIWSDGIGETLLKADSAGAIAVVGGTYRVSQDGFYLFDRNFIPKLLDCSSTRLGDAFLAAKRELKNEEINNLYVLLGDPALYITIPERLELNVNRISEKEQDIFTINGMVPHPFTQGIIKIQTMSGKIITTESLKYIVNEWKINLAIPSIYQHDSVTVTAYFWGENTQQDAAGQKIIQPIAK